MRRNKEERKCDLQAEGYEIHAVLNNGWIIFYKDNLTPKTFCSPANRFCTLFNNGRVAMGIFRPRGR
jgi:hypothetical protein